MIKEQDSLAYHAKDRPGKIAVDATTPCLTPRDLRLAYLPGATFPSQAIARDPAEAYRYTAKGNLVAAVTDGSAIPGLGNLGPLAAKPMQEGIAILFKRLADIDVFDLELDCADVDAFVATVRALEPTFGGVNLKDIRAPHGLEIYDRLRACMEVPVFHENLYSTAVVAVAGLINALELVDKRVQDVRVVLGGAGTVGLGCARLLRRLGVPADNLLLYDVDGLIHPDRDDLDAYRREFAVAAPQRTLRAGLEGADVFLGASAGGVLELEDVRAMAAFPIVFALATPEPEIGYEEARAARKDVIVATGLGQHPNAVQDVLSFPYIFRGALDVQSVSITEGMLLAAARSLAELAREDVPEQVERAYGGQRFHFGPEYLLPKPLDPRIFEVESAAVAAQAVAEGVARRPVEPEAYRESLTVRLGTGREKMRELTMEARGRGLRVVFPEGSDPTLLRACGILMDEGILTPVLLGPEDRIRDTIADLGLDLGGAEVVDPERSPDLAGYADEYFGMRQRHGVMRDLALERVRQPDYFGAMMLHQGHADMMIAGLSTHFNQTLRTILEVIGPAPGVRRISSHHLLLLPREAVVMADCSVNIDPDAEDLAEIAELAATVSRSLGLEPRVAMLSFSNFGSADHPSVVKVQRARGIVKGRVPELAIEGEMQLAIARDAELRAAYFPFAELAEDANVLVFPDLHAGSLAMQSLIHMGGAMPIGPMLMGTRLPVHLLQYGATVEEVVNLATVGVVETCARGGAV
ncbi:MAG TPA: phosphate acyltransferase [Candidatus Krumholzibacteria bacterium]|nr:phosphate acyltransferase [Candidatus Krumholzibacteria bacterium]